MDSQNGRANVLSVVTDMTTQETERLGFIRLAHVDAQIARGRLVPLRRRPDTRAIDTTTLWLSPCEECGEEVNIKRLLRHKRVLCAECKQRLREEDVALPRGPKRMRSRAEIERAFRAGIAAMGNEWFSAVQMREATGIQFRTIVHKLDAMVRNKRARRRNGERGRQWQVIA